MERREFIKSAAIIGGSLLLPDMSVLASAYESEDVDTVADPLLKGICDLHLHAAPDSKERSVNELQFARQARAAGYHAVMFKSNDFSCHDRAYIISQVVSDMKCYGSICMNRVHGDRVNPYAAQKAVETTGGYCKCIHMPTLDAVYPYRLAGKEGGVPVLDGNGKVVPEVVKVMEICAEANIIFATGHSSPEESIRLAEKAHEMGLRKFVVTHANSRIWKMTHDQIKQSVDLGAFIEYSCLPLFWGPGTPLASYERQTPEEFVDFLNIEPERSFVVTDLGAKGFPAPMEGMRLCLEMLQRMGVNNAQVKKQFKTTPQWLID